MKKYNPKSLANLKPGFKSKWKDTNTKLIRIPAAFEKQVLDYAHELDDGVNTSSDSIVSSDLREQLMKLMVKINDMEKGYKSNSASQLVKDLKALSDQYNLL
ncbi:hypothetical protein A5482_015290 (plasmid) [Cyanobacterium sp. IPPAS B-1200]|uniref:hypothetical protein n=1 Tax=Cyanobacterium sp. IPPAS B-1200 TaxID=1562720 RepID=UPI0008528CC9|nr:hypothetical protein [Cyanobacterium sp. IPPAS B-1200]OEJ78429.1 hypothetical protein A5482_13070 [Cyanobacterium sp. IPPAS B-1200]